MFHSCYYQDLAALYQLYIFTRVLFPKIFSQRYSPPASSLPTVHSPEHLDIQGVTPSHQNPFCRDTLDLKVTSSSSHFIVFVGLVDSFKHLPFLRFSLDLKVASSLAFIVYVGFLGGINPMFFLCFTPLFRWI